ncbi:unnamed protein product [Colias eurytheme]|nr:unnamed protein product [Colias eurytheme]
MRSLVSEAKRRLSLSSAPVEWICARFALRLARGPQRSTARGSYPRWHSTLLTASERAASRGAPSAHRRRHMAAKCFTVHTLPDNVRLTISTTNITRGSAACR